ncbi:MAG: fused MFS/spermidine synthase [Acidimicrobiia bacterium]|nr:fused MFS/spermidine synthase [Acidimicrobiia bacterium]
MSALTARALVFFTSAAVLVLEILAGRMMAPYVGVTLETFTGIIGTVLAGISIGSWLGGRLADRYPPQRILPIVLIGGGILAFLTYPIVTRVGPSSSNSPLDIVILAAVSFFLPAALLSAVTPTVVKIRLQTLDETGAVVGRLSAIATAGAIFGTFVTGFVLVAAWPSRTITFVVGAALVIAGVGMGVRDRLAPSVLTFVGIAVGLTAFLAYSAPSRCEHETAYYCVNVDIDQDRPTGRVLWLDTLLHSYVDLDDPEYLEFRYAQIFGAVLDSQLPEGPASSLSIGGGGFTFPRYVAFTRPGGRNTVLELDPAIVEISESELGLDPSALDIRIGDARVTLRDTPENTYDVVIGDAFGGPAVPWHLTTREFAEEFGSRLKSGGFYVLNLIDYPPLGFARAQTATLAAVFDHVAVVAPPEYLEGQRGGNFVLVASDTELDIDALATELEDRDSSSVVIAGDEVTRFVGDAEILTDDHAPVDQLITS